MFSSKEKNTDRKRVMERNVIAKNTSLVGDIKSEGDFRIDGTLEGTLTTLGRVIIGVGGFVKGNVVSENAEIEGRFSGQLQVSNTLTVKSGAHITGDVTIGKLSVEPGAIFNATCAMKGAVKELNQQNAKQKASEKTA
ncbi:bactofilin family protein [Polaribacter sp.]|uniref:bactofilin family protein n=1 Tax=Polaribacter sp. TaxID=1920175 RepID=UPI003F4AA45C